MDIQILCACDAIGTALLMCVYGNANTSRFTVHLTLVQQCLYTKTIPYQNLAVEHCCQPGTRGIACVLMNAATWQAALWQTQSVCGDRQKTVDQKTYCPCYNSTKRIVGGKGRGFWCGSCLFIRMGENIHEVRQRRDWRCPCCQDICNCSGANCLRARRNLAVTNQLIHEATKQGFKSVGSRVLTLSPYSIFLPPLGQLLAWDAAAAHRKAMTGPCLAMTVS